MYPEMSMWLKEPNSQLHAFRSGGGLRVVRLEVDKKLKGYGEHYNLEPAMLHCEEDTKAGGRPYNEVYGKIYPLYYTGTTEASSPMDRWLLRGYAWDIECVKHDQWLFTSKYYLHIRPTKERCDRIIKTRKSEVWKSPITGYVYEADVMIFANGEPGVSTRCLQKFPNDMNHDAWMREVKLVYEADNLVNLLALVNNKLESNDVKEESE